MSTKLLDATSFLRRVLWILFGVSLVGVAFSGALSYRELSGQAAACPAVGAPGTIFGVPACVFGLVMYVLLALISGFALMRTSPGNEIPRAGDVAG